MHAHTHTYTRACIHTYMQAGRQRPDHAGAYIQAGTQGQAGARAGKQRQAGRQTARQTGRRGQSKAYRQAGTEQGIP